MDNKLKKKKIKCPVCKREVDWEGNPYRPFCSRECKLADLYNWFSEEYRIKEPVEVTEPRDFSEIKKEEEGNV